MPSRQRSRTKWERSGFPNVSKMEVQGKMPGDHIIPDSLKAKVQDTRENGFIADFPNTKIQHKI
jgi:hypothetical protein